MRGLANGVKQAALQVIAKQRTVITLSLSLVSTQCLIARMRTHDPIPFTLRVVQVA
jgi:hypothetical protein